MRAGLAAALVLLAGPAAAGEVVLVLRAGGEAVEALPENLRGVGHISGEAPLLIVSFSESFGAGVVAMTGRHIGEEAALEICGREVMRMVLEAPLGGAPLLLDGVPEAEAGPFYQALTAGAPCPEGAN